MIVEIVLDLLNGGHKRIIVFTPSVSSAQKCARLVQEAGYTFSYAVSGSTPSQARDHYTSTFCVSVNDIQSPQVIFNCNVLTAGFDAPETSVVLISKPTKSAVRLQQMIGRALRGPKSGGTEEAEVHMIVDESYVEFVDLAQLFSEWESLWDV